VGESIASADVKRRAEKRLREIKGEDDP
jgi:hypothetical protein